MQRYTNLPISYLWEGILVKCKLFFRAKGFISTIIEENSYFSDFSGRFFYVLNLLTHNLFRGNSRGFNLNFLAIFWHIRPIGRQIMNSRQTMVRENYHYYPSPHRSPFLLHHREANPN